MKIIKLNTGGRFFVLIEAEVVTPEGGEETLWLKIGEVRPISEYYADQIINHFTQTVPKQDVQVIEHSDFWGHLPERIEGRII